MAPDLCPSIAALSERAWRSPFFALPAFLLIVAAFVPPVPVCSSWIQPVIVSTASTGFFWNLKSRLSTYFRVSDSLEVRSGHVAQPHPQTINQHGPRVSGTIHVSQDKHQRFILSALFFFLFSSSDIATRYAATTWDWETNTKRS